MKIISLVLLILLLSNCSKNNNDGQKNMIEYKDNDIINKEKKQENNTKIFYDNILSGLYEANYSNGNGTIINIENFENKIMVYRKHIQKIQITYFMNLNFFSNNNKGIYKYPSLETNEIIDNLVIDDIINIEQVLEVYTDKNIFVWLKIKKNEFIEGWFSLGECDFNYATYRVPYFQNRWKITEKIKIEDKIWTIRNLNNQSVSLWWDVDIYDRPGLVETNIISNIKLEKPGDSNSMIFLDIISVTEEKDTIDEIRDRWLKIKYNEIEGWIFGGYASVERGGPKYLFPESIISSVFLHP